MIRRRREEPGCMSPLVIENVRKSYRQGDRDVEALKGITLDVAAGSFMAVMGARGAGQSTLLHLKGGPWRKEGGGGGGGGGGVLGEKGKGGARVLGSGTRRGCLSFFF